MNDRELLELIAAQVGTITNDMKDVKGEIKGLKGEVNSLKVEITEVKERVIRIENDHGRKLDLLFDGYKQNSEQLNTIEKEVSKHEEIILRRVK